MKPIALILFALLTVSCANSPTAPTLVSPSSIGPAGAPAVYDTRATFADIVPVAGISCPDAAPRIRFDHGGPADARNLSLDWAYDPRAETIWYRIWADNGDNGERVVFEKTERASRRRVEHSIDREMHIGDFERNYRVEAQFWFRDGAPCYGKRSQVARATTSIDGGHAPEVTKMLTATGDNITWGD